MNSLIDKTYDHQAAAQYIGKVVWHTVNMHVKAIVDGKDDSFINY